MIVDNAKFLLGQENFHQEISARSISFLDLAEIKYYQQVLITVMLTSFDSIGLVSIN